jgi:hypothetical protein
MSELYKHIHPKFRHVLSLSQEDRLNFIDEPRWLGYTRAQEILDVLHSLLLKPKRPRMQNLLIVGESNNGKTTLISHFEDLCGEGYVNEDIEAVRPVVVAESPSSADEKALYVSILEQFFTPYRITDPKTKLFHQVIHIMRSCHVKMLIIDELHSLLAGSPAKQREVMNAIKRLCNELCIPIVGVGTQDAVRILHSDPQHASRFDVATLPKWELNKDFQKLVVSFQAVLPLKKNSNLHERDKLMLIHSICDGNIGDLHRLLSECAKKAITSSTEEITLKIIESNKWIRPSKGIRHLFP